jgi:hypothetical protein
MFKARWWFACQLRPDFVGSYGTRNVVGIGIIGYWERATDCIVLMSLYLSSYFQGIPFSWGVRLALSLRPEMDPISQPRTYILTKKGALNLTDFNRQLILKSRNGPIHI